MSVCGFVRTASGATSLVQTKGAEELCWRARSYLLKSLFGGEAVGGSSWLEWVVFMHGHFFLWPKKVFVFYLLS